ncbi:MAG TPA: AMP-binding protein [Acidobacteriaceae bacterium]|jgi:long-chain acyl-CoA synthetase|nr:AMP-binding protein [Acidobacteriaceae bacterium]
MQNSGLAKGAARATSLPALESEELPLERIYWNERENASRLLLTQPCPAGLREWTWAQAVGEARRMAAHLQDQGRAQGWPPGTRIAILSKNCAWWIMADFAIWMAGYTSVPIFPSLSDSSLAAILEHSRPAACFLGPLDREIPITGSPLERMYRIAFPAARPTPGTLSWEEIAAGQAPLAGSATRDALEVATIIYTSGTTGEPKGVMQTFQSLALMAKSMMPLLAGDGSLDRILSYLPLAHIAERAIVEMNCLYLPIHIFFAESPQTFLADLGRARPTIFFTVPRLLLRFQLGVFEKMPAGKLDRLLRLPIVGTIVRKKVLKGLALDQTRIAASGSAPLPVEILQWYSRLGLNLVEGYGMTETGITHVPLPGKDRPGYVGNASVYADTRISPEGEVQIAGPMNLAGYYRRPELTQASFTEDGYFRTGDRGEIDAEGRLRLVGRLKEEFKTSKGKYVIPAPIENELAASGLFESVCVLGSGMAAPFAAAVLAPDKRALCATMAARSALEKALMAEMRRVNHKLESYEQLRFLAIAPQPWNTENGLLTPTMKVRRAQVEERFAECFEAWESSKQTILWLDPL